MCSLRKSVYQVCLWYIAFEISQPDRDETMTSSKAEDVRSYSYPSMKNSRTLKLHLKRLEKFREESAKATFTRCFFNVLLTHSFTIIDKPRNIESGALAHIELDKVSRSVYRKQPTHPFRTASLHTSAKMVKRRRKTRTHLKGPNNSAATSTSAPKSFIIRTGKVPRSVSNLVQDTRKVMEPNTATRLRERNSNKLKDFISMAGPIGVTHLLIFGQTDAGTNLRILRAPRGPTLTFRVNSMRSPRTSRRLRVDHRRRGASLSHRRCSCSTILEEKNDR